MYEMYICYELLNFISCMFLFPSTIPKTMQFFYRIILFPYIKLKVINNKTSGWF